MVQQITGFRLPGFLASMSDWNKYRLTYSGGEEFRTQYLEQFTTREDTNEFKTRRNLTPIPTFAKAAVKDIRNALFQPMVDVIRRDGSDAYHRAVAGRDMGVDRRGSSMNAFIGQKVLEELLVMGKVGIFVDAPTVTLRIPRSSSLFCFRIQFSPTTKILACPRRRRTVTGTSGSMRKALSTFSSMTKRTILLTETEIQQARSHLLYALSHSSSLTLVRV